jgi:hypothetical protein
MVKLDNFAAAEPDQDCECKECGHTGSLKFFSNLSDEEFETALCGNCIYRAEGVFKNQGPGDLIQQFEEVERAYVDGKTQVKVDTTSFLGDFTHMFYLEDNMQMREMDSPKSGERHIDIILQKRVKDASEVFDSDFEHVSSPSPYRSIAHQIVNKLNGPQERAQ